MSTISSPPFSPEEQSALASFRPLIADLTNSYPELNSEHFLIRWLRARHLDPSKAFEMLRTSLKWREEVKADGIVERECIPPRLRKVFPTGIFGEDHEGNMIICVPVGRCDHRKYIQEVGFDTFMKFNVIWMEGLIKRLKEIEVRTGKKGLQLVEIIDMEGYSFRQLTSSHAREFIVESQRLLEANYPELVRSILVINAPKIFALAYKLVKQVMPQETIDKISIYGENDEEWKAVMRERFPLSRIPVRWGGDLTGDNIYCSTDTSVWPDEPELEYFTGSGENIESYPSTVKISPRDKHKLTFHLINEGSSLKWRFKAEQHDVGFQVTCVDNRNAVIVPWKRMDSHEGSITKGKEKGSQYEIVFDNSFSYFQSKTVQYQIEVEDD